MSEIEKLPQVKKLSEFLDNMNNNKESGIKIRKIVSDYLNTLFYSYADLKAFPAFDQKEFDQSYKLLEDYMYGTLVFQSFAPLYDFQILLFTKIAHSFSVTLSTWILFLENQGAIVLSLSIYIRLNFQLR